MNYKFSDLVNIKKLQKILKNFHSFIELPMAIVDVDGAFIIDIGFQDICKKFHRSCPETYLRCQKSDSYIKYRVHENKCIVYKCENGLTDMAAPIIIEGNHLASFFIGQFLFEKPDKEHFTKQASQFGFDVHDYMNALIKVPIYPEDKAKKVINFCTDFAKILTELGLKNLKEIEEKNKVREMEAYRCKIEMLESVGLLAGGIAHDFNNLLTVSMGNISLVKNLLDSPSIDKNRIIRLIEEAEKSFHHSKNLTKQLLTFAKGGSPVLKTASIKDLLMESTTFVLRGANVDSKFKIPDELLPVDIDEGQINQVITNIIINASHAMPDGGTIEINAENIVIEKDNQFPPLDKGKYVKVSIKDEGVGIPKEHLDKIFDPYFTTKEKGTGLGLTTSFSIVKKHGGYITVKSELSVGTTFDIYLKVSKNSKVFEAEHESDFSYKGNGKILVMDDQKSIRDMMCIILKELGYEAVSVADGNEAIELFKKYDTSFDYVILDLTVPGGKGGKETIKEIRKINPNVKAIVSSGYSEDQVLTNYQDYGFQSIISKPFSVEEIKKVLVELK